MSVSKENAKASNSGKNYTNRQYEIIFNMKTRGFSLQEIGAFLGRHPDEIQQCWNRLCNNRSANKDERIYKTKPPDINFNRLTSEAKKFIKCQTFETKRTATTKELSNRLGVCLKLIEKYIQKIQIKKEDLGLAQNNKTSARKDNTKLVLKMKRLIKEFENEDQS